MAAALDTYAKRLCWAMERAGTDVHAIAAHLDISYTAVKKVVDGKSSEFSAKNNAKTASFLGVDSDWLVLGEGEAVGETASLPFRDLNVFEGQCITFLRQLKPDTQHQVVIALNKMVAQERSAANPYPDKRRNRSLTSAFGDLSPLPELKDERGGKQ